MAATQTLAELRTRAKRRADMEGAGSSGFISDTEWDEYVNNGCQLLYNHLVRARGHEYYVTENDTTMVVGTSSYALPADHMLTLGFLASSNGTDAWIEVPPWQLDDLPALLGARSGNTGNAHARVQGTNIVVRPAPTEAFTLRQMYVPTFTRLSGDSDTFDGINGWEEYVVLHAAIAALTKEESHEHAAMLKGDLTKHEAMVESLASHRHLSQPQRVRMTRGDAVDGEWMPARRQGGYLR